MPKSQELLSFRYWKQIVVLNVSSVMEKIILVETSHEKCWIHPCGAQLSLVIIFARSVFNHDPKLKGWRL